MRFVIYYLFFSSSCELPTFPFIDLIDTMLQFRMRSVVSLLFISLLLPAHDVTEGNVDTSLDTIRSRSLLQFRILVLLPSESEHSEPGHATSGTTGPVSRLSLGSANDSDGISPDLSLSEGSAFSLRQHSLRSGSHAKHTSTPVSVPSPSAAYLTSSTR